MEFKESEFVELKVLPTENLAKEIIAFANGAGGTLYIGVADDGNVVGIQDADALALQISNQVRDGIRPDITLFLHYNTMDIDGKDILAIQIQSGTNKPYYLAKKGLRPEGVYVRQGYSSVPATEMSIRQMIKETDGDSFESMRSLNQDLTFQALQQEFSKRKVELGNPQMKTLQLESGDGLYTNLGWLLSDQAPSTLKAAVFEDDSQSTFQDRREFQGPLLTQLNDCYAYIQLHNQLHADFAGLYRIEKRDYPEVAVREALLNCLVHRDYSFSASTLVNLYPDRLEFVSLGGLVPGLERDDIFMGISVCRNPHLANVFYRLHLIEAYGTGMKKILGAYGEEQRKPDIQLSHHAFKITLPNRNWSVRDDESKQLFSGIREEESAVTAYVAKHGVITRKKAQELLGVGQTAAGLVLRRMTETGSLRQVGAGRATRYQKP
jgi:ATP-dependent DNA helicase RecG